MITNEVTAFENFKFKIGDVVILTASKIQDDLFCGMVVERLLVESAAGLSRQYWIASAESVGIRTEIELELHQRPVRM